MFVPNTRGGILVEKLKQLEEILSEMTGFRIKFSESAGIPLATMFNQDLGKGTICGKGEKAEL